MTQLLTKNGQIYNYFNDTIVESDTVFIKHLGGGFFIDINYNLYVCEPDDTLIKIEIDDSKGEFKKLSFVQGTGYIAMIALQIGSFYYQLSKNAEGIWKISYVPIISVPDITSIVFITNDYGYYYGDLMTDRRVYYVDKNNYFCMLDVFKGTIQTLDGTCVVNYCVRDDLVSIYFEDFTHLSFYDQDFSQKIDEERKSLTPILHNNIMCSEEIILFDSKPYILDRFHKLDKLEVEYSTELKCTSVIVVRENIGGILYVKYLLQTDNGEIIMCDSNNFNGFEINIYSGFCFSTPPEAIRQIKSARNI